MDPLRFGAADHPDTAPGAARRRRRHRRLRQLPRPAQHRRRGRLRPLLPGQPAGQRAVRRRAAGRPAAEQGRRRRRQRRRADRRARPAATASAASPCWPPRPSTRAAEQRRPSVQVGDPFMEKLLIEACLELYDAGLVVGIQDLGGAGLTCALTETAAAAGTGMRVDLDRVPLREPSMEPHEILASESQERMLLIVDAGQARRGARRSPRSGACWPPRSARSPASETDGQPGRLVITWHGHVVVDVPPGSLADDGPVYARPMREPADLILLQADRAETLPRPSTPERAARDAAADGRVARTCATRPGSPSSTTGTCSATPCSPSRRTPACCGSTSRPASASRSRSTATAGTPGSTRTTGAKLALAEAYRNVAVTGADAGRGHRLPQLRLARGPGRDVAVRRGGARPRRRLPRSWASR